jgi:hypothetical protein
MNKEKGKMKKAPNTVCKKIRITLFLFSLVLLGCPSPFAPIEIPQDPLPRFGLVRIQFEESFAKAVVPNLPDFDNLVFEFTRIVEGMPSGEPIQPAMDGQGYFTLELGDWRVDVRAYADPVEQLNLAAEGHDYFTLGAFPLTRTIPLTTVVSAHPGSFSWRVEFPAGTIVDSFTLTRLPMTAAPVINIIDYTPSNNYLSGLREDIPAGDYFLAIRLENAGFWAGISTVIRIYSHALTEYTDKIFVQADFSANAVVLVSDFDIDLGEDTFIVEIEPVDPDEIKISPQIGRSPGAISIFFEGIDPTVFARSQTPPTALGIYQVSFDVAEAPGFVSATGLPVGVISIVTYCSVHGHDFSEWQVTTPATCTETGVETRTCIRAGCTESETQTVAIDPDNHDFDEWEETTPATCTSTGVETERCARCGELGENTQIRICETITWIIH